MEQNKKVQNADKFKPLGHQTCKKNIMDYKVKTSSKYENIKSVVNSGTTIRDVVYQSDKFISKRKQENFKRIRVQTLNELLKQDKQIESIYDLIQKDQDCASSVITDNQSETQSVQNYSQCSQDTQSETNNINTVIQPDQGLGLSDESPFLILDAREESEFQQFKIKESLSFPASQLKRDRIIPQLLRYKNMEGKIIIIYAFDEKQGIPIAKFFFEKGFDNVYLLSGGIEKFAQYYSENIEGTLPQTIVPVKAKKEDSTKQKQQSKEKKILFQRTNQDDKSVNFQSVKDKELNIKTFFKKKTNSQDVKENNANQINQQQNTNNQF